MDAPAGPSNSSLQTWTHVIFGGVETIGDVPPVQPRQAPRASTHVMLRIRVTDSTPLWRQSRSGSFVRHSRRSSRLDALQLHPLPSVARVERWMRLQHNACQPRARPQCRKARPRSQCNRREPDLGAPLRRDTLRIRLPTRDLIGADHHRGYGQPRMSESELRHNASARSHDCPSLHRQSFKKVTGCLDLIDAIGFHRFTGLQLRDLGFGVEPRCNQANRFERASPVRERNHEHRVQPMTACPVAPSPFYALSGIDEYSVEVE